MTAMFYLCPKCGPVHVLPAASLFGVTWRAYHCGTSDWLTDEQVTDKRPVTLTRDPMATDMVSWLVHDDQDCREAGTLHMGTVIGVQGSTVEVLDEASDTVLFLHKRFVELVPMVPAGGVWE